MASFNKRNKIFIPSSNKYPKLPKPKKVIAIVEKTLPLEDAILKNNNIDAKRLAILVNICHFVADVNEQFSLEISEILNKAEPKVQLQFQRSIKQIRYHASDMVRFVDTHTSAEFSEGFGETADALKTLITDFFMDKTKQ